MAVTGGGAACGGDVTVGATPLTRGSRTGSVGGKSSLGAYGGGKEVSLPAALPGVAGAASAGGDGDTAAAGGAPHGGAGAALSMDDGATQRRHGTTRTRKK